MKSPFLSGIALLVLAPAIALGQVTVPFGSEPGSVSFLNEKNAKEYVGTPLPVGPQSFRVFGGETWIADSLSGRIQHFDGKGKLLSTIQAIPADKPAMIGDLALEKDQAGKVSSILVTSIHSQEILRFSPDGKLLKAIGGLGTKPGNFLAINRIEIGRSGRIFAGDKGRDRIFVFKPDGSPDIEIPWEGSGFSLDDSENLFTIRAASGSTALALVRTGPDGKEEGEFPLALEPVLKAELCLVTGKGEILLSYLPESKDDPAMKLARISGKGETIAVSEFKPPENMTRFLDRSEETSIWAADADLSGAPAGSFMVRELDLGKTPEG